MAYNYITPEERRKAEREARALSSPRYGLEEYAQKPVQSMTEPQQERAGVGERALHTVGDLFGNVISGAAKGLEGIYDLGAGVVGAVGGVFDKGFQERVKQHVAYDFTGEHVAKPLDRMTEHSYLNEGKVGSFIENVASGVGQMLPAVAVSLATGGIGGAVGLAPSAVTKAAQAAS
ncbi:MAG: hypothetical protein IJW97_07560, partial [Clostridia bacterium]|nr:hypothetical protein [Clostridia bacterium]